MRTNGNYKCPVVISAYELKSPQQVLIYSCEDCACPVSHNQTATPDFPPFNLPPPNNAPLVSSRELVEVEINRDYSVLFNPLGKGDAVVVNEPALRIIKQFQHPRTADSVARGWEGNCHEFEEALGRLYSLEMIHSTNHLQHRPFQSNQVLTAWLHVTNACNLKCPYCYLNKNGEAMDEATGKAAIDAVFRSAEKYGFREVKLKYAGGEATLNYKLVLALQDYAKDLSDKYDLALNSVLLSNGVIISDKLINELKSRGIKIMISLDGVGDYHDAQRPFVNGNNSFLHVEKSIDRLKAAGCPPHISITITNRNLAGLSDVVRYALDRNLIFSLNFFRDNECATGFQDLQYEEQAIIDALYRAFAVIEEYLPPWSVLGTILDRGQLIQPRLRPCGVGQDYVVITQRGEVAKCHMVIEKTLGDVFQSDPLALIRDTQRGIQNPSVEEKEGCRECTWRYWCSGGCPVATYQATRRFDIKSPNCNIYKAIYPAALRLEGMRLLKYTSE
jgi:uncharacterized protein